MMLQPGSDGGGLSSTYEVSTRGRFTVTREEKYVDLGEASAGGGFKSKAYTVTRR